MNRASVTMTEPGRQATNRLARVFAALVALILVATVLFLTLVVMLSLRIRQREMETMFRIGCSRWMTFQLQAAELGIVLVVSGGAAAILAVGALLIAPRFFGLL